MLITNGVPEGSILGPTLFNIHVNDLCKICGNTEVFLYADDNKLHASSTDINRTLCKWKSYQYRLLVKTKRTIDIAIGCRENLFWSSRIEYLRIVVNWERVKEKIFGILKSLTRFCSLSPTDWHCTVCLVVRASRKAGNSVLQIVSILPLKACARLPLNQILKKLFLILNFNCFTMIYTFLVIT